MISPAKYKDSTAIAYFIFRLIPDIDLYPFVTQCNMREKE